MRLTLELPDELVERIADAVAARLQGRAASGDDPLIGPADVGVSARTWRRAIREGQLQAIKIGRELKARRSVVDAWLGKLAAPVRLLPSNDSTGEDQTDSEIERLLTAGKLRRVK